MEILVPIFGILVVLVPVTGLTAILTLRFGGKPFIETLARELGSGQNTGGTELEIKLADLTEQLDALTTEVGELRAAQSFDQRLLESRDTASNTP